MILTVSTDIMSALVDEPEYMGNGESGPFKAVTLGLERRAFLWSWALLFMRLLSWAFSRKYGENTGKPIWKSDPFRAGENETSPTWFVGIEDKSR